MVGVSKECFEVGHQRQYLSVAVAFEEVGTGEARLSFNFPLHRRQTD